MENYSICGFNMFEQIFATQKWQFNVFVTNGQVLFFHYYYYY